MTLLAAVNIFLLQWLGVRLAATHAKGDPTRDRGWILLVGVLPLTGWRTNYIGPCHHIPLTRTPTAKGEAMTTTENPADRMGRLKRLASSIVDPESYLNDLDRVAVVYGSDEDASSHIAFHSSLMAARDAISMDYGKSPHRATLVVDLDTGMRYSPVPVVSVAMEPKRGRLVPADFPCHGCGQEAGEGYATHECCGLGDGPGFILCDRPACVSGYANMEPPEASRYFRWRLSGMGLDRGGNPDDRPAEG